MARATKLARAPRRSAGPKIAVLSVRVPAEVRARMESPAIGPYRVSISDLVLRGIELALIELDGLKGADAAGRSTSATTHDGGGTTDAE